MIRKNLTHAILDVYHIVVPPRIDRDIKRAMTLTQDQFPNVITLPEDFGKKMSERVVEILIAKLTYHPGRKVLDIGHANVMESHLRMLKSLPKPIDVTGIDIAPANPTVQSIYTSSVIGNIMKTEFPNASFDLIWCISALEHFGMDNSVYTSEFVKDAEMDRKALVEILRILRVGGMAYISVPFGRYENHGWFQNYNMERWQLLLSVARSVSKIHELYFRFSDNKGWQVARPDELSSVGYSDHRNMGASGLAVALIQKTRG